MWGKLNSFFHNPLSMKFQLPSLTRSLMGTQPERSTRQLPDRRPCPGVRLEDNFSEKYYTNTPVCPTFISLQTPTCSNLCSEKLMVLKSIYNQRRNENQQEAINKASRA